MNKNTAIGWTAGVLLFLIAAFPTGFVVVAVRSGAVGSVNTPGLIIVAFLVILALCIAVGYLLRRALDTVDASPTRTRADAWVAFYAAATFVVVGAFAIPVGTLVVMVNSDRSLQDSGVWFLLWWGGLHVVVGLLAYGLGRLAFWREPQQQTAQPAQ